MSSPDQGPVPPPSCPVKMLSTGTKVGLGLTSAASALSASAVLVVAIMVVHRVLRRRRSSSPETRERPVVRTHVDFYMISLLLSDLVQSLGGIINIYHIVKGRTQCGSFCTAQGALKSLGEPSAAMATMAITVHTFCVIFFHWTPPGNFIIPIVVCGCVWLYCGAYVLAAWMMHHEPGREYFQPVPYWCWVSKLYPAERISAEYFWLWFSAFASVLFYIPLFLFIRGNISVDPLRPWSMSWQRSSAQRQTTSFNRVRQSLKMLLYPVVYLIIVLPLSVVRWITFIHGDGALPSGVTFIGIIPFHLSGLLNVLLLILTRPSILVFGGSTDNGHGSRPSTDAGANGMRTSRTTRLNLSQAMEVSVHVQQDVYAVDNREHKTIRFSSMIPMSGKKSDTSLPSRDMKLDDVDYIDLAPMSPRGGARGPR